MLQSKRDILTLKLWYLSIPLTRTERISTYTEPICHKKKPMMIKEIEKYLETQWCPDDKPISERFRRQFIEEMYKTSVLIDNEQDEKKKPLTRRQVSIDEKKLCEIIFRNMQNKLMGSIMWEYADEIQEPPFFSRILPKKLEGWTHA